VLFILPRPAIAHFKQTENHEFEEWKQYSTNELSHSLLKGGSREGASQAGTTYDRSVALTINFLYGWRMIGKFGAKQREFMNQIFQKETIV